MPGEPYEPISEREVKGSWDRDDLTKAERALVLRMLRLSRPGLLRVLAAVGNVSEKLVDAVIEHSDDEMTEFDLGNVELEPEHYIGVPRCSGAQHRGPAGCTCKMQCTVPADLELAARWWGFDAAEATKVEEYFRRSQEEKDREEVQRRKDAERKARAEGIRDGSVLDFRAAFDRKTDG